MDDTGRREIAQQTIRRFCEAAGSVSREELAKILDVSRQTISNRVHLGDIPPAWYFRIADQFQVSLDWLYRGVGQKGFEDFDSKTGASRIESMGRDFLFCMERKGASVEHRREVYLLTLKFAEKGLPGIDALGAAKESIFATLQVLESLSASPNDFANACLTLLRVAFEEV